MGFPGLPFVSTLLLLAIQLGQGSAAAVKGIDVSSHHPEVKWNSVKALGITFVYIKATEGSTYTSPQFNKQYMGASNVGLIRGAIHVALPDQSSGAAQAKYFLAHGGKWSEDGNTLPGAIDLADNPSGSKCYGLTPAAMVDWIKDFGEVYHTSAGRNPVIYTESKWWTECTGNSGAFVENPLWIARYGAIMGDLPGKWKSATFWQYADKGPAPGNQNIFMGDMAGLKKFAKGS